MAAELKPLLLDETGKEMRDSIIAISNAIKNTDTVQKAKEEIQAEGATQVANVKAASEEIIGKVEQIDQNTQRIDELKGDIAKNVLSDKVLKRRVDAIWKLNQGISYQFETDATEAYRKTVLSGAKLASVKQIGGKTIVWNQLINKDNFPNSKVINGITVTNNTDGSITLNGTSEKSTTIIADSVKTQIGHVFLFKGCPSGGGKGTYAQSIADSIASDYGNGRIWKNETTYPELNIRIDIGSGVTLENKTFIPQLIDLTLMFGAGNEPSTVEEFESMFPDDYYPYDAGTLLSAPVNDIVSEDNSGNVLQSAQVPDAVLNLDGYGDSVSDDVYNYVDWEKKQYVQRVGKVVLDSFTSAWGSVTHGYAVYWTGGNFDHNVKMISNNFVYSNLSVAAAPVYSFGLESGASVTKSFILPSTITSLQEANEWLKLNETIIYYELAEPVIIDISDLIPEDFNPIEVEAGGSLTFKNSNGESYRVPIPNEVEYAVKLSEVV